MLNSKAARLVIALLAAVVIWGYVVGEVNPSKTKTIRNVPITYTYEDTLNERDLAIGSVADEYISVEISGARAILGDINPNDISATINVASAQKGENEMSINLKVPSGITVNKQSATRTVVVVESLVQKPVDVTIDYTGEFAPGDQGSTVNTSLTQVIVSGAESLVENVASARGVIDAANVSETLSAIACQLEAADADGRPIAGVKISPRTISVASIIARSKTVELITPTENTATDRFIREFTAPESVTIFGNVDVLAGIESLTADAVDISSLMENKEVDLTFTLPDGVKLAEGEAPKLNVSVTPIEDKAITFAANEIKVNGAAEGFEYKIADGTEISVKLSDRKSVLDGISKEDIKLSVNVEALKATGALTVQVECGKDVMELKVEPNNVTVEVTDKSAEGNSGSGN